MQFFTIPNNYYDIGYYIVTANVPYMCVRPINKIIIYYNKIMWYAFIWSLRNVQLLRTNNDLCMYGLPYFLGKHTRTYV